MWFHLLLLNSGKAAGEEEKLSLSFFEDFDFIQDFFQRRRLVMKCLCVKALAVFWIGSLLILGFGGCGGSKDSKFVISDTGSPSVPAGNSGSGGSSGPPGKPCSIEFVEAEPSTIALKGTGGPSRSEMSVLTFKVVDENNTPVPGQTVNFTLSTGIGGLSLANPGGISDSEGLVQVTVKAGTVPTHIRVRATLSSNTAITIDSDALAVSTGLPDQNSVSLGAEILNPEAWNYNNEEVPIIFQAADHFNNFVPDGTIVYFTTEGGSIIGSAPVQSGVCTVTWRSGNPRPADGRITILAFCIGEESFTDSNTNGLFDPNDHFIQSTDLAEPFRDDNENGVFDSGEEYWDYNDNGRFDSEPNHQYNGCLCSEAAQAASLCTDELVYAQASLVLCMSGSFADITFSKTDPGSPLFDPNVDGVDKVDLRETGYGTIWASIADLHGNPMPEGTKVAVKTTNGKIIGESSFTVPNTSLPAPSRFPIVLEAVPGDGIDTGMLTVEVTTPKENKSTNYLIVVDGGITPGVTPPGEACSIEFISAEPSAIALKGTGGPSRSEISVLTFRVVDENNKPVMGQNVDFKLSTGIGGLSLSDPNAVSDSEGLAQVRVNAGTMPTHIRIQATLTSDPSITIVSDELVISTGFPDQNSITLTPEFYNPEALYYIVDVPITFQAADHFNNFVPDGTIVYFTTEGGSIDDSCTLSDGECEVTWRSGNPIPADGRVTILAHCIGEESFINNNASGLFDGGDQFDLSTDLGEPFCDNNENGRRDPGEEYWDYNHNRTFDGEPNGIYNGTLCSEEARIDGKCTDELVYAQASMVLVMSGSIADITFSPTSVDLQGGVTYRNVAIYLGDENKNPLPAGTMVSVNTTNGEIVGPRSFTVPNTNHWNPPDPPTHFTVTVCPSKDNKTWGILTVEVTTPHNVVTTECIEVTDDN
ncbi:MAG: hypothetical protein AB1611_12015 [bacterium]